MSSRTVYFVTQPSGVSRLTDAVESELRQQIVAQLKEVVPVVILPPGCHVLQLAACELPTPPENVDEPLARKRRPT